MTDNIYVFVSPIFGSPIYQYNQTEFRNASATRYPLPPHWSYPRPKETLEGWVPIVRADPFASLAETMAQSESEEAERRRRQEKRRPLLLPYSRSPDQVLIANNADVQISGTSGSSSSSDGGGRRFERRNRYHPSDPDYVFVPPCLRTRGYKGIARFWDLDVYILLAIVATVDWIWGLYLSILSQINKKRALVAQKKRDALFWADRQYYFFDMRRRAVMWEV